MKFYFFTIFLFLSIAYGALTKVPYSGLNLTGSIVSSDISASAAIPYSKLSLGSSIVSSDISVSAAIPYSKLNLASSITSSDVTDGTLVNADINASADIAMTKLASVTSDRALISSGGGKITNATTTATEIGYVNGVTSALCGINQSCVQTNKTFTSPTINSGTVSGGTLTGTIDGLNATITDLKLSGSSTLITNATVSGSTITVRDDNFVLYDNIGATKRAAFELSSITAGQTRVFDFPDNSGTIPILNQAQTWSAAQTFSSSVILGASAAVSATSGATVNYFDGTGFTLNHSGGKRARFDIDAATSNTTAVYSMPSATTTIYGADRLAIDNYVPTSNWGSGVPAGSIRVISPALYIRIGSKVLVWGGTYFRNDAANVNINWSVPVTSASNLANVVGEMRRSPSTGENATTRSRLAATGNSSGTTIAWIATGISTNASDAHWEYQFVYTLP